MTAPLMEVRGLSKAFGKVVTARQIDLAFNAGQLTSIIGPNGAGKSTFINMMSGALAVDAGAVLFEGRDVTLMPIHRRVALGICRSFQVVNVFPGLTVFENVEIPTLVAEGLTTRLFAPRAKEAKARQAVLEVLTRVGLTQRAEIKASELSHGDQRLLEVAVALAARPKLLFLDEPTAGMNPVERVEILKHIRRINQEGDTTFIIVEHDMDIVFSLSDRVVVLHRGDVICDGPPAAVQCDPQVRECYLGDEVM
jgi:branched-chain amino acid transport system ATP-binding protein